MCHSIARCSQSVHPYACRLAVERLYRSVRSSCRKFFCRTPTYAQRIFTERLPGVVKPLAPKAVRLHDVLQVIAFAVGGEAGARLGERLGMATSPATLIRMMRQSSPPAHPTLHVLGVDER